MSDRIKLSKRAKQVFRLLDKGIPQRPADMNPADYNRGALELEEHGLINCFQEEGSEDVIIIQLKKKGRRYIAGNPTLRNPIDWKFIIQMAVNIAAILAALFACSKL